MAEFFCCLLLFLSCWVWLLAGSGCWGTFFVFPLPFDWEVSGAPYLRVSSRSVIFGVGIMVSASCYHLLPNLIVTHGSDCHSITSCNPFCVSPRVLLHLVFFWVEDQIWSELDAVTCVRFLGGLSLSGCGCSTAVSMGAASTLLINRFCIMWPPLGLRRIKLNVVSRVSRAHCLDGCYFAYLLQDRSYFATQSSMFLLDR